MKALGAYFEVLRGDRGRAALAADVGISEMSIWRIEDGSQEPRAELLNALVRTLRARWSDKDIQQITAPDSTIKGLFTNVQPLIDRGLALCR